jgi:acyl dehydratase
MSGDNMGLNKDYIGNEYPPEIYLAEKKDIDAYASAIGASDSGEVVSPCFSVSYELPLIYKILKNSELHGSPEQAAKNMMMLLHGDQTFKFYKPIDAGDQISCRVSILDIVDKGSGEVIKFKALSSDEDGNKIVESVWGLFIRGIGSGQRPDRRYRHTGAPDKAKENIFKKTIKIPKDITKVYSKAANDMNPIHLDEDYAERAGLPGTVVHGMCTMAMSIQSIVQNYLNGDTSNVESIGVRFSAPVFPSDELEISEFISDNSHALSFEVSRTSDGVKVIKDGSFTLRV